MTTMSITVSQQNNALVFRAENPLALALIEESLRESGISYLMSSDGISAFLNQGDDINAMNKKLLLQDMAAWYQSDDTQEDGSEHKPSTFSETQEGMQ